MADPVRLRIAPRFRTLDDGRRFVGPDGRYVHAGSSYALLLEDGSECACPESDVHGLIRDPEHIDVSVSAIIVTLVRNNRDEVRHG